MEESAGCSKLGRTALQVDKCRIGRSATSRDVNRLRGSKERGGGRCRAGRLDTGRKGAALSKKSIKKRGQGCGCCVGAV